MTEHALVFGQDHPLIGVVTEPSESARVSDQPAFIISNSGIVHRVGPSHSSVRIARQLAERGHLVARIDHSGIGDSDPRTDLTFHEAVVREITQVMDDLQRRWGVSEFVTMGICSGAEAAFRSACADDRIVGAVMINGVGMTVSPEVYQHSMNTDWARRYWKSSLFSPRSWWRALTGRSHYKLLVAVMGRQMKSLVRPPAEMASAADLFTERTRSLVERGVRLLFVHSDGDHSQTLQKNLMGGRTEDLQRSGRFQLEIIRDTDHTFTFLRNQRDLLRVIERWVDSDEGRTGVQGLREDRSCSSRSGASSVGRAKRPLGPTTC